MYLAEMQSSLAVIQQHLSHEDRRILPLLGFKNCYEVKKKRTTQSYERSTLARQFQNTTVSNRLPR